MKGVYVLTALVGLGLATWVTILIVNGARRWLRKREEKRLARQETFDRLFYGDRGPSEPDGL